MRSTSKLEVTMLASPRDKPCVFTRYCVISNLSSSNSRKFCGRKSGGSVPEMSKCCGAAACDELDAPLCMRRATSCEAGGFANLDRVPRAVCVGGFLNLDRVPSALGGGSRILTIAIGSEPRRGVPVHDEPVQVDQERQSPGGTEPALPGGHDVDP